MGIIHRLKKTVSGGKHENRHPTREITTGNTVKKRKPKGPAKDQSKLLFMTRGEVSSKHRLPVDPRERQERHIDRLFDISNQLVEESHKTKTIVPATHGRETVEDEHDFQQQQQEQQRITSKLTVPSKPLPQTKANALEASQSPDTIETSRGSCSLVEMFSALQCCGIYDITNVNSDGISSSNVKGEKQRGKQKPKLLSDTNAMSIPREISFTRTSETFDTSNYILLSEIEDNVSLRASIVSRLRRGRSRTTSFSTTRIYVEPPHGGTRSRSLESRAPVL